MENIEIPDNVVIHCPKVQYRLARVAGCIGCEHFANLEDRFPGGDEMPFSVRYIVKCRHDPVKRELKELAE
jgi:hypothetical protein